MHLLSDSSVKCHRNRRATKTSTPEFGRHLISVSNRKMSKESGLPLYFQSNLKLQNRLQKLQNLLQKRRLIPRKQLVRSRSSSKELVISLEERCLHLKIKKPLIHYKVPFLILKLILILSLGSVLCRNLILKSEHSGLDLNH